MSWYVAKGAKWESRIVFSIEKLNIAGACYYIPGNIHQRKPTVPLIVDTTQMAIDARNEHGADKKILLAAHLFEMTVASEGWLEVYRHELAELRAALASPQ